jgi:hypothetical protein
MPDRNQPTEVDRDIARAAVGVLRHVVPNSYACVLVMRNTETGVFVTVSNMHAKDERPLLEASLSGEEIESFDVPEPH